MAENITNKLKKQRKPCGIFAVFYIYDLSALSSRYRLDFKSVQRLAKNRKTFVISAEIAVFLLHFHTRMIIIIIVEYCEDIRVTERNEDND